MWAGGDCVSAGYLDNPALNAERYAPDPFLGGGRRMFRTRDLGRWTPDGELEHLGRTDDQVKVRGFRVELDSVSVGAGVGARLHPGRHAEARRPQPGVLRLPGGRRPGRGPARGGGRAAVLLRAAGVSLPLADLPRDRPRQGRQSGAAAASIEERMAVAR